MTRSRNLGRVVDHRWRLVFDNDALLLHGGALIMRGYDHHLQTFIYMVEPINTPKLTLIDSHVVFGKGEGHGSDTNGRD